MQVVSTLAVPASGGGVFVWMASPAKTCSLYNTRKLKLCAAVGALPRKDGCHLGGDVVFRDGGAQGPVSRGRFVRGGHGWVGLGRSGGGYDGVSGISFRTLGGETWRLGRTDSTVAAGPVRLPRDDSSGDDSRTKFPRSCLALVPIFDS